jgi:hypothetical protein
MWSAVLVGAVAVMISGSSSAYAQQREGEGERGQNPGFSNEDRTLAIDSRIASRLASLKERLRLTPEQAKNWPAYEAAFQAVAKLRRERMEAGQERPSDPVQRMRQRAEALGVMGAALSRLADAQGPLYNSFDEDQKRQFAMLSRMLGDQSDMYPRLRNDDRRSWRGRDDDDRRGWRGRDDDDRRGWRDRDDGDRRSGRGRDDDDRRGWRDREDDDRRGLGDRCGCRDRSDNGDRRRWGAR